MDVKAASFSPLHRGLRQGDAVTIEDQAYAGDQTRHCLAA